MSGAALIMMIFGLSVTWGGAAFFLFLAVRKQQRSK